MTAGFLVVDKPGGMTSNDVVGRVRGATGIKKVGHAGTLDPLATGAMVVAVGPVTRLIRFIQEQPKEYLATAQFGVATDTLDADGAVLEREPMDFTQDELESAATRFVGVINQVPPMVSALKHEGRRLYELARRGEVVERDARPVEVHELEILSLGAGPVSRGRVPGGVREGNLRPHPGRRSGGSTRRSRSPHRVAAHPDRLASSRCPWGEAG